MRNLKDRFGNSIEITKIRTLPFELVQYRVAVSFHILQTMFHVFVVVDFTDVPLLANLFHSCVVKRDIRWAHNCITRNLNHISRFIKGCQTLLLVGFSMISVQKRPNKCFICDPKLCGFLTMQTMIQILMETNRWSISGAGLISE